MTERCKQLELRIIEYVHFFFILFRRIFLVFNLGVGQEKAQVLSNLAIVDTCCHLLSFLFWSLKTKMRVRMFLPRARQIFSRVRGPPYGNHSYGFWFDATCCWIGEKPCVLEHFFWEYGLGPLQKLQLLLNGEVIGLHSQQHPLKMWGSCGYVLQVDALKRFVIG